MVIAEYWNMNSREYEAFVSSFSEGYELIVSEEEFKNRSEQFNKWLVTLDEQKRLQVVDEVTELITKTAEGIKMKQSVLEEMILVNDSRMKANSHYGKY